MNTKNIIIIYMIIILAMILYPPFTVEYKNMVLASGYSWIWEPIVYSGGKLHGVINAPQLIIQFIATILLAGAAIGATK